jgi:2-polyprenyl-6-methoxyphenol hydroxylase-like FAD-dependent oxidoreductase
MVSKPHIALSVFNPSTGAHSWVRKAFNIAMEGEQTEYVWGVIDFTPDTDFPDIRNKCVIHSNNGTCMVIPREGDKVRLYIQMDSKNGANSSTMNRVDKSQMSPHQLVEVRTHFFRNSHELEYHRLILGADSKEIISAVYFPNSRIF